MAPTASPENIESKLIITQEQQNTISNVQVSRNELISKELCASQTFENQVAVMLKQNRQNHLAIFDFLKSLQQEPFEKFFEVLIEAIQAVENCTQQVRLLIGLFGIYNGQKLNPRSDLCCLALKYLAKEDGVTSQQVIGFLKFTFVTNGDLHNAELSDLVQFDKRHKQCFVGFKQWLQWTFHLPPDLTMVLPNSCYILGLPFAKRLQNESAILTEHIPSDFLGLFIQILTFSFEKDEESFAGFLDVAKKGFLDLIEKIKTTQLLNLFSSLVDQLRSQDRQWYLNIYNTKRLIEGTFLLVKENKVRIFDKEVCQNLLSEVTNVDQYLAAPSFIKSDANQDNEVKFKTFLQLNQKNRGTQSFLQSIDFAKSLPLRVMDNFSALKINPHFIQELAMKIICQKNTTYSFLNIGPGLGKTKLILAAGINLIQTTDFPVFILNSSETLCDRDFQEAVIPLEELKITCASVISQNAMITFSTTKDFIDQKDNLPENYHVLLDEYQNIFFIEKLLLEFVEIVKHSKSFIGFSGSPLNPIQKKLLNYSFDKSTLVLQLTPRTDLGEQETIICKTQALLVKKLAEIADEYRYDTPQVFILDSPTATALIKGKKNQRYEYLIDKKPAVVNNMLTDLFNKPNDKGEYGTYIIDEEMGTGTDFKTSSNIESKGGLVLVFGIKPSNTSTFEQLSCRVGRIFNKSRRFYIIQDAAYTGSNGDFLKYQLKMLGQKECEEARALLCKIKPDMNNVIIENYDKQARSMVSDENYEDIGMQDEKINQLSCTYSDSDELFSVGGLETESKKSQKIQNKETKNEKQIKKRLQKESDKSISSGNKLFQHSKNVEECKICGDAQIDPHDCKAKENAQLSTKFDLKEGIFDPGSFLKINADFNQDQISVESSMFCSRKNSAGFQHNTISKNIEKASPKADAQLQKRQKGTENTWLLEQDVKKSQLNEENIVQKNQSVRRSSRKPLNAIDEAYFDNYGHKAIHDEMLNDKIRCQTYNNAISASVKGKTVLDIGAGTGFLSVIAAKAGATHVYAIEFSEIASYAEQFINDNGCKENITLIKKRMEEVNDLPKVDIIISEWMGYFLLYENMLASVLDARNRFLKDDGVMLPCEGRIYIAGVEWVGTETNGVVLKPDKNMANEAQITTCSQDKVISNECLVSEFNLQDCCNPLDDFGCQPFTLQITKDAVINAFVGWFDVALTGEIVLSTGPSQPETHWKQTMFFLKKEIQAKTGEQIDGTFKISANAYNHRSLRIDLAYKLSSEKSFLKQYFVLEQ